MQGKYTNSSRWQSGMRPVFRRGEFIVCCQRFCRLDRTAPNWLGTSKAFKGTRLKGVNCLGLRTYLNCTRILWQRRWLFVPFSIFRRVHLGLTLILLDRKSEPCRTRLGAYSHGLGRRCKNWPDERACGGRYETWKRRCQWLCLLSRDRHSYSCSY